MAPCGVRPETKPIERFIRMHYIMTLRSRTISAAGVLSAYAREV